MKIRAKNLLRQIDLAACASLSDQTVHTGFVNEAVFFDITALLKIKLQESEKKVIKLKFGKVTDDRIDYKEALAALTVDTKSISPMDDYWIVRGGATK